MTRNNISQHILRTALCLALFLGAALNAAAQTSIWDGTTATAPENLDFGTLERPILIASAENLFYVAKNPAQVAGKFLKQTVDIDLAGYEWIPIGVSNSGFSGKYDGMSHTIKGLRVDWGRFALQPDGKSRTNSHYAYGLFGYLIGSVENLVIEDAEIFQSPPVGKTVTDKDLRVGILAGSVGCSNGGYIRNILIRNSKISSHPSNKEASLNSDYFMAQAYMIGGLVGDTHHAEGITSTKNVTENFTISNIYVEAEIDVSNVILGARTFSGSSEKGHQYYVGGLIGRARSVPTSHMPKHVVFGGKINAPTAMVGPIFAGARATGSSSIKTYEGAINSYAGDFSDKTNGSATESDFQNILYKNYKIQDYSDGSANGTETLIDNATLVNNTLGTQTLKAQPTVAEQPSLFAFDETLTAETMAMFQGVNRGTYFSGTQEELLAKLNTANGSDFRFVLKNGEFELQGEEEIESFERTTMHKFEAKLRNLKDSKTYNYKWIISDAEGNSWHLTVSSAGTEIEHSSEVVLKKISADKTAASCAIIGEFHPYNKVTLEVYDGTTMLATESHDMGDVHIDVIRDVYTTSTFHNETVKDEHGNVVKDDDGNDVTVSIETKTKHHFLFKADVELEGHHIADEPEYFEGVNFLWQVVDGTLMDLEQSQYDATPTGTGVTPPNYEAHIKPTYVGNLRLTVSSNNPYDTNDTPVIMSHSVINGNNENYIEQVIKGLHLSLTMEEYYEDNSGNPKTQPFDPAHYHVNGNDGKNGFYDNVYKGTADYDNEGKITGIKESTKIKPLIFKAKVVDQFGNEWTSASDNALSRFRIQWNYRISGEGKNESQRSTNYNVTYSPKDGHYDEVNGWFGTVNASDPDAPNGLLSNITDKEETDYSNIKITGADRRSGHFKLINDSIFIIHPNILHRTSAFWVRVKLYDIVNDPNGNHPIETVLAFNQLGVKLTRKPAEKTVEGKVIWKLDGEKNTYVSGSSDCTLDWYRSLDPTDPDNWEFVQHKDGELGDKNARLTYLDQEYYGENYFYKLVYKSGSDLVAEEIIGPQNVVYVYDRAMTNKHIERTSFNPYDQITNQYYPTGLDTNHGHDPYNAVATMEQAYKLLDEDGKVDDNIIVVMGYMEDRDYLAKNVTAQKFNRRATIAGAFGKNIKGSTIWMSGKDEGGRYLGCATAFQDINWYGDNQQLHFYCCLNDVTFGTGVKMATYEVQPAKNNGLGNYEAPHITIIGGFHNNGDPNIISYPETNFDPTRTTMTFRSGTFGRIISGSRNNGDDANATTKNVFGSPKNPHRVRVVVDIQEERTEEEKQTYRYDIGLLVGGQTDGTLYAESEIDMNAGSVSRYISGNISYGRKAGEDHPSDSFFGSTTLNLRGGEILELYGGTLGRHGTDKNNTDKSDAYFYGRSIINIYNGTIDSDIFGAGAGGVTGLGDATAHTSDNLIPYYNSSDELKYGDYATATGMTIPTMTLLEKDANGEHKVLDFKNSYVEVNVMGGTITGNIYGGGYGYSSHITADKALEQAGYLFGNSFVNISGGLIDGNIYGGGAGSDQYNKSSPNKFKKVACVYGNTSVKISGGTIIGNVYGGGKGILGFPDMAKVIGSTSVEISDEGNIIGTVVEEVASGGHVYGGASLGEIQGNTSVKLLGGYIGGNVFAGSEGNANNKDMATVYGKTYLLLDGAEVNASIYGGCNVSSIRKPTNLTATEKLTFGKGADLQNSTIADRYEAMTKVIINSGIIGNNIYGGSRGDDVVDGAVTDIEGDTYVRINGGDFINFYYLTDKLDNPVTGSDGKKRYRDFNVFGGGEKKCTIEGTAHLDVRSGLMNIPGMASLPYNTFATDKEQEEAENAVDDSDINLFIPHKENPNSLPKDTISKFMGPYMDLTYRRFSLYGGGYGEKTNCLNTDVYVYIPTDKRKPHGRTLKVPYDHQSFFDIAGGGYSGDIGYWADSDGKPVTSTSSVNDYQQYVGGECKVTIDGFTYCRKVIGGGFYGSCKSTNTKIICGSLRQVYGGSLLGYVHDQAKLEIGNRPQDLAGYNDPAVTGMTNEQKAKWLNDHIFFTENVYGGNDVKGIVGTQKWRWTDGTKETVGGVEKLKYYYGQEGTDGGPLWQADVNKEEDKGVVMNIFGGTFMGDVYGAGNGHYRGYYVPGWIRYEDGPERMYRMVRGIDGMTYDEDLAANSTEDKASIMARHRVYRTRPMVGSVNINITGNSADDMVHFQKNFYGGGRECSIGQWNTILPMEDPRRLSTGGHLHINIGGNVIFDQNLYMGVYGGLYGSQQYLPKTIKDEHGNTVNFDLDDFHGQTTTTLEEIGEAAYDHWWFNKNYTSTKRPKGRYEPGFPAPGQADGNFGLLGEHMFRGYFKNIEMEGDVELTFYKNLYDSKGNRKRWLPAELAVEAYDAENITMNSFFLGGKCGYMTNNTYNVYCYTDKEGKSLRDVEKETISGHTHEQWGSVYRITMPKGVTIKDKLVMGVEDAVTKFYPYKNDFTAYTDSEVKPDPTYIFEGGLVTQTTYSFDHIAYNDMMTKENENSGGWNPTVTLPSNFYHNTKYQSIWDKDSYTLQAGIYAGKTIYRRTYDTYGLKNYMLRPDGNGGYTNENNQQKRYGLAVVYNDNKTHATGNEPGAEPFFGRRSSRTTAGDHQTVSKLTARCEFDPQKGTKPITVDPSLSDELKEKGYHKLYGGIIYGGCYNSGVVIGDIILNVASNMLGKNVTPENQSDWFDHISGLGHYIGRVYGGGYGVDTRNDGDTYINLLRDVQAMNIFGGGMQGTVTGDTYINYIGTDKSYIYGAIYGGGFQGTVGKFDWRNNDYKEAGKTTTLLSQAEYDRLDDTDKAKYHIFVENNGTNVTLVSGNVDHVYGGSCMGNLYGATNVHLYDVMAGSLPHLDFSKYDANFKTDWPDARLVVGTVYGGNDISGEIIHTNPDYQEKTDIYDTNVTMTETRDAGKKDTPGANNGYNGFPLVGNLYGGSNGNYCEGDPTLKTENEKSYYVYTDGSKIKFASGNENEIKEINIGDANEMFDKPLSIPNVDLANIDIKGGTVVNLYGGGDFSTITNRTNINVAYILDGTDDKGQEVKGNIEARAGFKDDDDVVRVWNTCHLTSREQMLEVMNQDNLTFYYNIYRIFGGNNHADMAIQPTWNLKSGHVGSVYSGANFGKMTYYNPTADPTSTDDYKKFKGLSLTINSRDFHANAVYGGGRVGDVHPAVPAGATATDDLYGTTLTIKDGVIDHVYGGNDVSGEVHYGSKVDIQGAISGDVYCAGNGNYVYQYGFPEDYKGNKNVIGEDYIITDDRTKSGYRYFILPLKTGFDVGDDLQKMQAINSYRPNVTRSSLKIGSTDEDHPAYVHGSIYMGGNSATVLPSAGTNDFIEFNIGSNVIINSIFMGSNGEHLVDEDMIKHTNDHNGFNIGSSNLMLDTYMAAVDVEGLPKDFVLDSSIENAYIGNFFLGGNRGSMTTSKTIELEFPENITIFGKIVGGSNNANYEYGTTAKHVGGLATPLQPYEKDGKTITPTDKVYLKIKSKFLPKYLKYPDGNWRAAKLEDDVRDDQGKVVYRKYEDGKAKAYYKDEKGNETLYSGKTYLQPGTCNIYGGCYNSGVTVGNIKIDLYSDMLLFGPEWKGVKEDGKSDEEALLALRTREQTVINCVDGLNDKSWHPLSVIGGGYGSGTSVYGDIDIRLLPTVTDDGTGRKVSHPSCGNVFGGAQEGVVVGNTTVELRDGTVLANVYGASESSYMYGSTQILIGYPEHYECLESGEYKLARADVYSKAATVDDWKTNKNDNSEVIKRSVWYRKGDIVPKNVYEQIITAAEDVAAKTELEAKFTHHNEDTPDKLVTNATWDDINISVGDPSSRNARTATDIATIPYFGYGNVYGGGFVPTAANSALIGQKTLLRFTDNFQPKNISDITVGNITNYGGNSAIMIWDNPENGERNTANTDYKYAIGGTATGGSGATIKDHVSIGSGQFVEVKLKDGDNKMGLYYYKPAADGKPSEFVHQPSGNYSVTNDAGKTFYEIISDGGIFGGGRKVYCEGFRACDLAYYGYADYAPQMAKLINTFQRIDLLSLTDCCLQLQASQDFASTTSDAGEKYSITRVGELRMNSSLAGSDIKLNEGVPDALNIGNTNHNAKRSRNFLGFYRSVKFLGALVSNVGFTNVKHHDDKGEKGTVSYSENKKSIVDTYYQPGNYGTTAGGEAFKTRNVGTAANMIGINNGYSLRIQGTRQKKNSDNNDVDEAYYGPALGVTEIKLLTMAVGEGGGYVYALNKHDVENNQTPSFFQTLGNFVFPGAAFGMPKDDNNPSLNYIIDDCFPIGHGYDEYIKEGKTNVNNAQDIHYWYVNGQRYFFNATLTAYTGTPNSQTDKNIFTLDNSDNLIMLAGIDSETKYLRVKSIKWDVPNDYSYDLTRTSGKDPEDKVISDLLPGYNLYVSVGDQPQTLITPSDTDKKNAWVAKLKRTGYKLDDTKVENGVEKFKEYAYDDLNLAPETGNDNAGNGKYKATKPLLGLALTDAVANNNKEYYTEHLSRPAKMQVVLGARNSDGLDYEYTLNLTIVYLKGTDVFGNIVIENCALPGERIYANAFDVKVDGDDPVITNRKWVLYKIDTTLDDKGNVTGSTEMPAVEIPKDFRVEENSPERIAIPAYLWMNGWHLGYEMTINGKTERVYTSLSSGTEHPVITVHNYHRMMAWDRKTNKAGSSLPDIQDLQLTSGARVYIEDDKDLEYFLTYMNSVQDENCSRRGKIGSAVLPEAYDSHVMVDPRYGEGIHFILLNDVVAKSGTAAQNYQFEGRLSGLGHNITLGDCTKFMGQNGKKGSIYFTGFLSSKAATNVIGKNQGRIFGCYYYNDNDGDRGHFLADHSYTEIENSKALNDIQYSYQNAHVGQVDAYDYTTYYDDNDFANGKAAYDLNAFYLNERYKHATNQTGNENSRFKSYVYNYYGDGEYRYANWDVVNKEGTATALRKSEFPNYYNLGRITQEQMDAMTGVGATVSVGIAAATYGKAATYHNCNHPQDDSRTYVSGHYVEVETNGVIQKEWLPDYYQPNFPQDFMFFGQDIKAGDKYPTAIKADGTNRVFRASGFYGTQEDRGFYFNRNEAVMRHPQLTAVDFTGQRTRDRVPSGNVADIYKFQPLNYVVDGKAKQTIIFPPVLDLPLNGERFEGTTDATQMQLGGLSVAGNSSIEATDMVTKNLLVYIPTDKVPEVEFPQDEDETAITAHRINWNSTTGKYTTTYLHLVDKQDFNAPIAFNVTERVWYVRTPEFYSSGNNAWEGLCLPFTVKKVSASVNGEITHFYGTDEEDTFMMDDGTVTQRSHEYWLRKFANIETDTQKDETTVYFYRPASAEDKSSNAQLQETPVSYDYKNTFFEKTYGKDYERNHQPQYTETGATYSTYRPITEGFPYLVTFPGDRYYEFDLSEQKITYENRIDAGNAPAVIPVSDEAMKTFTHGDYDFKGTFSHVSETNTAAPHTENAANNTLTTTFKNKDVLPFRAYLASTKSIGEIAIGGTRSIGGSDEEEEFEGVQLFVRGNDLVITSDHDFECPLHGYSGQLYRRLSVKRGENIYHGLSRGVYIALGHKFVIRR